MNFDNQSGEPALVKIVGPTTTEVEVPTSTKKGADVIAGDYTIKIRYGAPGNYRYTQGEKFSVTQTATARSVVTITLHKVVDGNFSTKSISEADFNTVASNSPSRRQVAGETVEGMEPLLPASIVDSETATEAHLKIGWKVFGNYNEWYDTKLSKDEVWFWETKGAPDALALYSHDGSRPVPKEGAFAVIIIEFMAKQGTPILEYSAAKGELVFQPSLLIGAHFDPSKHDPKTPLPGLIDNSPVGRDRRSTIGKNIGQVSLEGGKGVRVVYSKDTLIRNLWFLAKEHCDKKDFTVLLGGYKPIRFTVSGTSSSELPTGSKTGK